MGRFRLTLLFAGVCASRAQPSPADIEKLVCKYATQKQVEDKATSEICAIVEKKFPIPDCQAAVEFAWNKVLTKCPKGSLTTPSPEDIEKLVCKVASQKMIEDGATTEICALIAKHKFPIYPWPECQSVIEKKWEEIVAQCPKGRETLPSPKDVEKLVCKYATQKQIEDKAISELCEAIQKKTAFPECKMVVELAWEHVTAMCPKGALTMPTPQEIEKLVCKIATQKQIEDKATSEVCAAIEKKMPIPDCQPALELAWDKVVAKCPKGYMTTPSPTDIEKLVCKFASQKQIEDKATSEICSMIEKKFPIPDCQSAVELAWNKVLTECPKNFSSQSAILV